MSQEQGKEPEARNYEARNQKTRTIIQESGERHQEPVGRTRGGGGRNRKPGTNKSQESRVRSQEPRARE
jgi:hypothetical protein